MKNAGKRRGASGIAVAAFANLWMVAPAPAEGRDLILPPNLATPRFGVAAVWPHWTLTPVTTGDGHPSAGDAPQPALPVAPSPAPTPPEAPEPSSPPTAPSPPPPVAPAPSPTLSAAPALQPSLVQRELLMRDFQRVVAGNPDATGVDRRELALRALTLTALPPSPAVPDDPLRAVGLERRRFGSALALTGGPATGMELDTLRTRGGAIRRQQLQVGSGSGPAFHLSVLNVDRGFSRFQDLTAEERSWAGAMSGMRRLEFGAQKLAVAGGQSELSLLQLADGKAGARRMSLGLAGQRWTVHALSQRVDDSFKRLGDLTEADRKSFGAERGIARDALDLGYAFNNTRKLAASRLALRSASGAAERRQIDYAAGPHLQLRFTSGRVDPKFDRINDLLEADRATLAPQRGTRWSDLTASLRPTRWLSTENHWYQGVSLETGQRRSQIQNLWTLQLAPRSKLVLLRNLQVTPTGPAGRSRTLTQSVRLEQWLTHRLFFTGLQEMVRGATSIPGSPGRKLALHFNTAPGPALQAAADYSSALTTDAKRERILQWNLGLPVPHGLALLVKGERHAMTGGALSGALTLGVTGPTRRTWDMALTLNTANPGKGAGTRDLGLRLAFAGLRDTPLFHETRLVVGMGDTQGLSSAVPITRAAKPVAAPAGKNAPPSPVPCGPPARRVRSISLESKLRGQPIALGYAAAAGTAGGLTFRFSTDPKRRLQAEVLREVRDLGRTSLVARQRYAFQARMGRASRLSCAYETQPELSPGKLLLGHAQTKAEAQTKIRGLDVTGSIAWDQDMLQGTTGTFTSLGIAGNLDSENTLHLSYTGRHRGTDPALPTCDVRLAYERKPDEMLRLALSADWQTWSHPRPDELAWQLDLTAVF